MMDSIKSRAEEVVPYAMERSRRSFEIIKIGDQQEAKKAYS